MVFRSAAMLWAPSLVCVFGLVPNFSSYMLGQSDAVLIERTEFRRLVILFFRLCCYEVRSDSLARKNRDTWLDPTGGISNEDQRHRFLRARKRIPESE